MVECSRRRLPLGLNSACLRWEWPRLGRLLGVEFGNLRHYRHFASWAAPFESEKDSNSGMSDTELTQIILACRRKNGTGWVNPAGIGEKNRARRPCVSALFRGQKNDSLTLLPLWFDQSSATLCSLIRYPLKRLDRRPVCWIQGQR
jgi:hypothetical protein